MKTFILTIAASLIICSNTFAQINQQEWKKTENWKAAINSISNRNVSSGYVLEMANEAEKIFISGNAVMFVFDADDAYDFFSAENDYINEKGFQFHRITVSTDVNLAVFQGTIEGEAFYLQQYTYEIADGSIKVAQVLSKERITLQNAQKTSAQLALMK